VVEEDESVRRRSRKGVPTGRLTPPSSALYQGVTQGVARSGSLPAGTQAAAALSASEKGLYASDACPRGGDLDPWICSRISGPWLIMLGRRRHSGRPLSRSTATRSQKPPDRKHGSWTWQRALERAAEVLREEGFRNLWFRILGETVYRRMVLVERLLNEPIPEVTVRLPVVISLLRETELDEYLSLRPGADPSDIRRRLAAGQLCFVARHEGRIIHARWATTRRAWIDYLACEIRLAPDEVYTFESFTDPSFRGQNVAPAQGMESLRYFRDAGYRRLLAAVVPENKPAFHPLEKLGYRRLGVIGYLKVGPWRYDSCRIKRGSLPPGESPATYGPAYWDGIVRKLEDKGHYLDAFLGELKRHTYLALIQRWGGVPATGRVLKTDLFEEAMGPDALLAELSRRGRMVIGMDVSAAVASQAQRQDAGRPGRYLAADTRRLPFASNTLALVVSPSTLDHFSDPDDLGRSLCELARVLERDGRLIITLDNRQNIFDPLLRLVGRIGWVPYYLGRSYRVDELRAELEAAGFLVQETTAILHNPRLMAVAAVALAQKLRWPPLAALVQRVLIAAQRLEQTRWRYYTGSFVAAKAVRRAEERTRP
jgi:SAM-dependent methyltransferase/GNAT superfamily N-acetyltransferase